MAEKAALVLAGAMAPGAGERAPGDAARAVAYARGRCYGAAAVAVAAPAALAQPLGAAAALPTGVALSACLFLLGLTAGLWRFSRSETMHVSDIAEHYDP